MKKLVVIASAAVLGIAGIGVAVGINSAVATHGVTCEQSVDEALLSNRIVGVNHSYRKDNPGEYTTVRAYLEGGARPSTSGMTHMGLHLVYLEDTCRTEDGTTTTTTTTTTTPPPVVPVGVPGNWNLHFQDEFDAALDTNLWTRCHFWSSDADCQNVSTQELVCYQAPQAFTQNGELILRLEKRQPFSCDGHTLSYASGMVQSGGKPSGDPPGFNYTYGYVEARFKLPAGQALWPGFWSAPQNFDWPPEIDFAEFSGNNPNLWTGNYHYSDANGQHQADNNSWIGPNFSSDYHVFGVDWSPGSIKWYVDGVERASFSSQFVASEPLYLYFTLSLGGVQGTPDPAMTLAEMKIDYVRVWKRA